MSLIIRPAQKADVAQITELVNHFAGQNIMLPRSEENVYQTIEDWLVAIEIDEPETGIKHEDSGDSSFGKLPKKSESSSHTSSPRSKDTHRVIGCGALVPLTNSLVEIRSLAIHGSQHGKGLGSALVLHLVDLAREREYKQLCALTLRPNFFTRLGFALVDRWSISPKVWQACIYCPKFHRCDEVAVLIHLEMLSVYHAGEEYTRQPGWNHLLKWREWQPLRLAYQYQDNEKCPQ